MDILTDIRQQLLSGKQPVELVKAGYAKSSVYYVAKKLHDAQLGMPGLPVGDEVAELRRRKEIIKLEGEIAELEAAKQKLPERVAALEAWIDGTLIKALAVLACSLWGVSGERDEEKLKEIEADWMRKMKRT